MQKIKNLFPGKNLKEKINLEIKNIIFSGGYRKEFLVMSGYSIVLFAVTMISAFLGYFEKSPKVIFLSFIPLGVYFFASDFLKRKYIFKRSLQFKMDSIIYLIFMLNIIIQTGDHDSPIKLPLIFLTSISTPLYGTLKETVVFLFTVLLTLFFMTLHYHPGFQPELLFSLIEGLSLLSAGVIISLYNKIQLENAVELEEQMIKISNSERRANDFYNKIKEEKAKVDIMINSIGDGVFVIDKNYNIILFNQAASDLSGFNFKEVIGKRYDRILKFKSEKTGEKVSKFIKDSLIGGKISQMENHTVLVRKSGEFLSVADSSAPVRDVKGNIIGSVVVFRDNTKMRQIDKMKTEFVSVASHQLRTPLTAIKLFTEMMVRGDVGKLNKDQSEYLGNIYLSTQRMVGLVNDLLNVTRIESGRLIINPQETNLVVFVENIIAEAKPVADAKKVKIILKKEIEDGYIINIDQNLFRQVVHNLIMNAVRYSNDNGAVEVIFDMDKSNYKIQIKDNGIGIPKEAQQRMFEKFFRADNAIRSTTDGTGLGLYVSKMIVETNGGKIWFESVENKGTTFYLSLPKKGMKKKTGERGLAIS